MKKTWIGFGVLALFVFSTAWLSVGCKGTLPAIPAIVPTPLPSSVISNFSNGSLNMNSSLLNGDGGYFLSETYGGAAGHANMIDGSQNPDILVPNPGDGSAYAIHIYGPQTDPAPTTYPAMEVFAFLKNDTANPYYDLTQTSFTGIRFDVKIPKNPNPAASNSSAIAVTIGDNNPQERFAIACAPMVPPTTDQGGTCGPPFSSNCYNYFWSPGPGSAANWSSKPTTMWNGYEPTAGAYNLGPTPNNDWAPVSFLFSQLRTDSDYGEYTSIFLNNSIINGTLVSKTALFLLWKFGDNGKSGTAAGAPTYYTYTDFWVDNVQFF